MKVVLIMTSKPYVDFLWSVVHNGSDAAVAVSSEPIENWDIDDYDIGISFMYTQKIPKDHIQNRVWINFHPGPLPMYRGRNLCYHAIMNEEKWFGVTVHYMDENFDTGDIIEVFEFPIHDWWSAEDLSNKTIDMAKKAFAEYFPLIVSGREFDRKPNVNGEYYVKDKIPDVLNADPYLEKWVRAVTYKQFYPKINIHGVTYKIVRDE